MANGDEALFNSSGSRRQQRCQITSDDGDMLANADERVRNIMMGNETISGAATFRAIMDWRGRPVLLFGDIHSSNKHLETCSSHTTPLVQIMRREFANDGQRRQTPPPSSDDDVQLQQRRRWIDFFFEITYLHRSASVASVNHWGYANGGNAHAIETAFNRCFHPSSKGGGTCGSGGGDPRYVRTTRFHSTDVRQSVHISGGGFTNEDMPFITKFAINALAKLEHVWIGSRLTSVQAAVLQAAVFIVMNQNALCDLILDSVASGSVRRIEFSGLPVWAQAELHGILGTNEVVSAFTAKRVAKQLRSCPERDRILRFARRYVRDSFVNDDGAGGAAFAAAMQTKPGDVVSQNVARAVALMFQLDQFMLTLDAVCVVDVYTLARMFKTTIEPTSREVWVFAGIYHTAMYAEFLLDDPRSVEIAHGVPPHNPLYEYRRVCHSDGTRKMRGVYVYDGPQCDSSRTDLVNGNCLHVAYTARRRNK